MRPSDGNTAASTASWPTRAVGSLPPLGAITEEHFDRTFNSNVKGTLFTVQTALPLLTDGGSIILTASTASVKGTEAFSRVDDVCVGS